MSTKILLLQQSEGVRRAKSLVFGGAYFHSLQLGGENEVSDYLNREQVDVIVNDCRGAEAKGLAWVEELRKGQPRAKVVLVTEAMDLPMVIKSIRLGVKDVLAGPLDLGAVSKRIGELAGSGDKSQEALRNADWSTLQEFLRPGGAAEPPAKAPPTGARRAKAHHDDAVDAERRQLSEDSKKLKEQMDELERRRAEVTKAEQRIREKDTQSRAPQGDEVALRRERESLRMQVMELESERDLLQKTLAQREESLRIAEATLKEVQAGRSPATAQHTPPPFTVKAPDPAAVAQAEQALASAQQETTSLRLRLAEVEENLTKQSEALARAQEEGQRWREQLGQCERERDQARDFLHAKEKALANATATLQRLQTEVADYERRLRETQVAQSTDTAAQEASRAERDQRVAQLASLEAERDFLRGQIAAMEAELSATRETVERLQREASEFSSRLQAAGRSPGAAQEALLQEREQLLAKVARLESERNLARDQFAVREKTLAQSNATVQRLQSEIAEYDRRLREALESQSSDTAAGDVLRQEREQRVAQLASLEAERDFLREQLTAMEAELSTSRETVERLQREATETSFRLQSSTRTAPPLGDEVLRQEREQLLGKVARLESEKALARDQFATKEKALSEAHTTVQKLRHELVQLAQKSRERETDAPTVNHDAVLQRDLSAALEKLGLVELERDHARDQLTAKEAALDIANATVESLRGELDRYLDKLRQAPLASSPAADEALRAERDQLRQRLAKAERERDQARELFQAKERAWVESNESLKRLRVEGDLSAARSLEETSRREAAVSEAEQRLLRSQQELQDAQSRMDEAWNRVQAEQERVAARKKEMDEQAVALANRERLLALERSRTVASTGAEEIGASERRLRLLRTELASLAAALNEREAALRTQESRVEQLLLKADTDLRTVQAKESMLESRASEIEQRIAVAEARASEIIAVAQARAEAEERAHSGLSEALRRERESVRKAEARYLAACHEVGEQLQALADREASMRKREFQLDERENTIRSVLQRVLSDANALVRGDAPKSVFGSEEALAAATPAETLTACGEAKSELDEQRRAFAKKSKRLVELSSEIDQDSPRTS